MITNQNQITPIESEVRENLGRVAYLFFKNNDFHRVIDLLCMSQMLVNAIKGKILIGIGFKKEYSYMVTPAAKALEGSLLSIAIYKGMITKDDIDKGVSIGKIYDNLNGKQALAKSFVLKDKDRRSVDKIYSDWYAYRNKVLHYDEDHFVNNHTDAEEIIKSIYETIRLAYKIFVGAPDVDLEKVINMAKILQPRI